MKRSAKQKTTPCIEPDAENMNNITQVLVHIQIELRSDPIERTPLCFQTEITGSGKRFERTIVWTMVWFRSDQRSIRSGRSDHSLFSLDHGLGRSDQRSIRSRRSDHSLFRLDHCLGSVWSEVNSVWKVWFRVHYFFQFFLFFFIEGCWICQEATIKQRSDQRLI